MNKSFKQFLVFFVVTIFFNWIDSINLSGLLNITCLDKTTLWFCGGAIASSIVGEI